MTRCRKAIASSDWDMSHRKASLTARPTAATRRAMHFLFLLPNGGVAVCNNSRYGTALCDGTLAGDKLRLPPLPSWPPPPTTTSFRRRLARTDCDFEAQVCLDSASGLEDRDDHYGDGDYSDPFGKAIHHDNQLLRTNTVDNELDPVWTSGKCSGYFSAAEGDWIHFTVTDRDGNGNPDDSLGEAFIRLWSGRWASGSVGLSRQGSVSYRVDAYYKCPPSPPPPPASPPPPSPPPPSPPPPSPPPPTPPPPPPPPSDTPTVPLHHAIWPRLRARPRLCRRRRRLRLRAATWLAARWSPEAAPATR